MKLCRGDIILATVYDENGDKREIEHPQVVIQDTIINQSRIGSVVTCGISTNMNRAFLPGNILLENGEGNLPKRSIVIVSQVSLVNKSDIKKYIGSLKEDRIEQIFLGMKLVQGMVH